MILKYVFKLSSLIHQYLLLCKNQVPFSQGMIEATWNIGPTYFTHDGKIIWTLNNVVLGEQRGDLFSNCFIIFECTSSKWTFIQNFLWRKLVLNRFYSLQQLVTTQLTEDNTYITW